MKILFAFIVFFSFTSCQNSVKPDYDINDIYVETDSLENLPKEKPITDTVIENRGMVVKPIIYERDTVKAIELKNTALDLLINNGNLRNAQSKIYQSIMYNPQDADALYILGNIEEKMVKYDEAYKSYTRAIELNPNHIDAIMKCAILASKTETKFSSCYYLHQACNLGDPKACEGVAKFCTNKNSYE
ncbi:tetratricopeptide repeat protein [Flavobacterium sp. PLA-1-15]|uniref:tetratricopeptide repeat protein n=1 Tax=Flavobacterium sp. PLA-1-15 TaxID=3380533 RepID=UPI003B81E130